MATVGYKKSIGIALCSFYGVMALTGLIQILTNQLGLYNPSLSRPLWIFQDIICCIAMAYIAFNKKFRPPLPCQIGASILSALFAIFAVNISLSYADINIWYSLGQYAGVIISVIELVTAAFLFYYIKAWLSVRISAFVYWIPCMCSSFFFSRIKTASDMAQTTSDWTLVDKIFNALEVCDYFALAFSIITVILTLIWINKKTIAPNIQSNPIDII